MTRPTVEQVTTILEAREVGARLGEGAWRPLPGGRWAIPAVTYMFRKPRADVVVAPDGKGWKVDREARPQPYEPERIFAAPASLEVS